MPRRTKILIPEARQELDKLKAEIMNTNDPTAAKFEAAKEIGIPLKEGYNGTLTSEEAGKIGGRLGGSMVREMINMAKKNLH